MFELPSSFVGFTARGTYDVQCIGGCRFRDFDDPTGAQERGPEAEAAWGILVSPSCGDNQKSVYYLNYQTQALEVSPRYRPLDHHHDLRP